MYNKLKTIEKMPLDLFWLSNTLVFKKYDELHQLEYNSLNISLLRIFPNEIFIEFSKNNSIIITMINGICVFNVEKSTNEIIEIDNDSSIQIKDYDGKSLVTRIKKLGKWQYNIFFLSEKNQIEIDISTPSDGFIYNNYIVLIKSRLEFSCYLKDLQLWEINIKSLLESENTQFFGDLIKYEGKLYFFLSDQNDKYGIYCIDIFTGKVINQTNQIGGFMQLSEGLLYMNNEYTVTTLHPDTFEIKEINLRFVLEPKGLDLGYMMKINLMVGRLYYFVCQNGRSKSAIVGIVNLDDKSLVWTTEIQIESGSYWIKEIQVYSNRLFVFTQGGTLHIFELG